MGKSGSRKKGGIRAYTDESGNTGLNLFDIQQPEFWTGTVLTNRDLDQVASSFVDRWADALGVDELHGSDIGLKGIDSFAKELKSLIKRFNLSFIFTRIEKSFHASLKYVDTVLDSGNNKAVNPLHYSAKPLRRLLAYCLVETIGPKEQMDFWEAYKTLDTGLFVDVTERVLVQIKKNDWIAGEPKSVLVEALEWAKSNPGEVLDARRGPKDSPNFVALTLVVADVHEHIPKGARVVEFIHDEQNQFAKSMEEGYETLKIFTPSRDPMAFIVDGVDLKKYDCRLTFRVSHGSAGVAMADVVLWLTKRWITQGWSNDFPHCLNLQREITRRGVIDEFTRDRLLEVLQDRLRRHIETGDVQV